MSVSEGQEYGQNLAESSVQFYFESQSCWQDLVPCSFRPPGGLLLQGQQALILNPLIKPPKISLLLISSKSTD
jgi:hypothetical protein